MRNLLKEEKSFARWKHPTENAILDAVTDFIVSVASRIPRKYTNGNTVPDAVYRKIYNLITSQESINYCLEKLQYSLFRLAEHIANATNVSLFDLKKGISATSSGYKITLNNTEVKPIILEFVKAIFNKVPSISLLADKSVLTRIGKQEVSSLSFIVDTFLHEVLHTDQHKSASFNVSSPPQYSYLDDPKKKIGNKGEYAQLVQAKLKGEPYDAKRFRELYMATPAEIDLGPITLHWH